MIKTGILRNFLRDLIVKRKNTVWLVALSISVAICQFIIYLFINKTLGRELLGVWSLVVAATSIGQISNFGFSGSLVRHLPDLLFKKQRDEVQKLVGTVNASSFILTFPVLVLLYFPAIYYGKSLLDPGQFSIFRTVILYSMSALFINNLFLVYSYTLDAMEKHFLRATIQIAGWIFYLILSLALLPVYGLQGVAMALLVQNILQFIAILIVTKTTGVLKTIYPISFYKSCFKKIYSFGINLQGISILTIFFDPLIKFFITKNLGLGATGNYEVANKIAVQLRNLLVSANQIVIPRIVIHRNAGTEDTYFRKITQNNTIFSVFLGMVILLIAPVAVFLFSGNIDWVLMKCLVLVNIGWTFNMVTSVHYYSSMGLDKIGKLVIVHLLQSLVVLVIYFLIEGHTQNAGLYYAVPPLALLAGSIYNSVAISGTVSGALNWMKSGYLIFFVAISVILVGTFDTYGNLSLYLMPAFFFIYICWILLKINKDGLKKILNYS